MVIRKERYFVLEILKGQEIQNEKRLSLLFPRQLKKVVGQYLIFIKAMTIVEQVVKNYMYTVSIVNMGVYLDQSLEHLCPVLFNSPIHKSKKHTSQNLSKVVADQKQFKLLIANLQLLTGKLQHQDP